MSNGLVLALIDDPVYVRETCKMGQGAECCRYLVMTSNFACAKRTPFQITLDARGDTMNAQGDNCPGWPLP